VGFGFARLGKADGQGENEEQREDSDDSLEGVEFALHGAESCLGGRLFVAC
jgi:hypothetical protein